MVKNKYLHGDGKVLLVADVKEKHSGIYVCNGTDTETGTFFSLPSQVYVGSKYLDKFGLFNTFSLMIHARNSL